MYKPNPTDTSSIILCDSLYGLMENIASHLHEIWAVNCASEGWEYDKSFDERGKRTPRLVPYSELSENDKEYERNTAAETLRLILKLGYDLNYRGQFATDKTNNKIASFVDADEAYLEGEKYNQVRDYSNAITYYRYAADHGHLLARCRLGEYYLYGNGVKTDKALALTYIEPIAKQNIAHAQHLVGIYYHMTMKEIKSREFNELAAKQGHIRAQYCLGNSFEIGYYDGPKNYKQAFYWYTIAATQGHAGAQRALGCCYEYGRGVRQNDAKAIEWYHKAAKQGDTDARRHMQKLKQK